MMKIREKVNTSNYEELIRKELLEFVRFIENTGTVILILSSIIFLSVLFLSSIKLKDCFNVRCKIFND